MVDFSVAIRTYNGEKRLPAILERLRSQINVDHISWEIVIVDNNSTDNTAKIIQQYQSNWGLDCPIKYYFEPQQGASFARILAIKKAQAALVGFLDDDNLPSLNWVSEAYAFGQAHPEAGAFGSQIHGQFEGEPPKGFSRIASFLPIIKWGKVPFICGEQKKALPPGAGLTIRRQAWLDTVPDQLVLKGPVGKSLSAKGEDIEALLYIKRAGWQIWYNPAMEIYHQIPMWRFEREYLIRFCRGIGLGRYYTRMLGHKAWQRPLIIPAYMLSDAYKLVRHTVKYHDVLATDPIAAGEREFILSSLISPFYFWKQQILQGFRRVHTGSNSLSLLNNHR